MTDIVDQLRKAGASAFATGMTRELCFEAADEIEILRLRIKARDVLIREAEAELGKIAERDIARKKVFNKLATHLEMVNGRDT